MSTLAIVLIIVLLFGAPFGYQHYGWYGGGVPGLLLIVILILALTGRL